MEDNEKPIKQDLSLDDIFHRLDSDESTEKTVRQPFKFLDSYAREDSDIFFGREEETDDMYRKFYQSKILLIYGISGTGKSSVVSCGLLNKIPQEDIYPIKIRCGKEPYEEFFREIKKHRKKQIFLTRGSTENYEFYVEDDQTAHKPKPQRTAIETLSDIFDKTSKPILLIFDQFEEIFIMAPKSERIRLLKELKQILAYRQKISIIFIIREEYLANLTEFESQIPDIFRNRIRVEKIDKTTAKSVIEEPCKVCGIGLEKGSSDIIIERLTDSTGNIELTYLQVLMDRLYKKAIASGEGTIKLSHIDELKSIGNVLTQFLDEQLANMHDAEKGEQVLKKMISPDGTKRRMSALEILEDMQTSGTPVEQKVLNEILQYFVNVRIITEKDEHNNYELRHDSIAARIYERMSAMEKELTEVKKIIENAYYIYLKRSKLLDVKDLQYLAPYEDKLYLKPDHKQFIVESKKHMNKAKRRRNAILSTVTISLMVILSGFTVWALWERSKAVKNEKQANEQTMIAESQKLLFTDDTKSFELAREAYLKDTLFEPARNNLISNYYRGDVLYRQIASHESGINSVQLSPDEKYLLTASNDNTAKLWDVEGKPIKVFRGHNNFVNYAAFSPDGKTIATASADKTVKLWDLNGNLIRTIDQVSEQIFSVVFSPDGQQLLLGLGDGSFATWSVQGKLIHQYSKKHGAEVFFATFSKDGKKILTASADKTAALWDLNGNQLSVFKGHTNRVNYAFFSPDENSVITASKDSTARIWTMSGKLKSILRTHNEVVTFANFSHNGKLIITAGNDNIARIWDLVGNLQKTLKGHTRRINYAIFTNDDQKVFTASGDISGKDNTVRIWNTGFEKYINIPQEKGLSQAIFTHDSKNLLVAVKNKIRRYDLTGRLLNELVLCGNDIIQIEISADNSSLLVLTADSLKVRDLSGKLRWSAKAGESEFTCATFDRNSQDLLTGCANGNFMRISNGKLLKSSKLHNDKINYISVSSDGKLVATASDDNTFVLSDSTGKKLFTRKSGSYFSSVNFSKDNQKLVTANGNKFINSCDIQGNRRDSFSIYDNEVSYANFVLGDKYILSASKGAREVKLSDLKGIDIISFPCDVGRFVKSAEISDDGRFVLATNAGYKEGENVVRLFLLDAKGIIEQLKLFKTNLK